MFDQIAIVAPYEGLREMAEQVVQGRGYDIDTFAGDLDRGLGYARQALGRGKKIIISRGGTAKVIREILKVPVVEIKVTGYDLLRVLYPFRKTDQRIAVIGYDNVIFGSRSIAEIIGGEIVYLPIVEEAEIDEAIEKACLAADIVVGDTLAVRKAREKGLAYRLVKSGEEAVINAIDEAVELCKALEEEVEKRERYMTILNAISEGVMAVNQDEEIIIYNPGAEKLFEKPREEVLGRKASGVIPNTRIPEVLKSGTPELARIQNAGRAVIATNRIPILVEGEVKGVVATFQDITRIQELEEKIRRELFKKGFTAKRRFEDIVGESALIRKAVSLAREFSKSDSTILILGESGTGKEIFAQSIHNASPRRNGPFVAINCAAIPGNLLESELFGYVEGAFTGARKGGKKGLFELAHGGTIFLDEISEMEIRLQARILRVLQEMEVMRIGDDKVIPIDVRIVAATNRSLIREMQKGRFRDDLFYRLNVLRIDIPPLSERREDIIPLAESFLDKYAKKYRRSPTALSPDFRELLLRYSWPGNIRELENVVEKYVLIGEKELMKKETIEITFSEFYGQEPESGGDLLLEGSLAEIETRIVRRILEEEDFNKSRTASRLGITRVTLNNKLKNV